MAIITKPLNGRAACQYCGQCTRGCKSVSSFSSSQVLIPPAQATGRLTLITNAMAREIVLGKNGKVEAVSYIDRTTRGEKRVYARSFPTNLEFESLERGAFSGVGGKTGLHESTLASIGAGVQSPSDRAGGITRESVVTREPQKQGSWRNRSLRGAIIAFVRFTFLEMADIDLNELGCAAARYFEGLQRHICAAVEELEGCGGKARFCEDRWTCLKRRGSTSRR